MQLPSSQQHIRGSPFTVDVSAQRDTDATQSRVNVANTVQTAGEEFAYLLYARDQYGNDMTGQVDLFFIEARAPLLGKNVSGRTQARLDSRFNGLWTLTVAGTYTLHVFYNGMLFRGGSFDIEVVPGIEAASAALLIGASSKTTTAYMPSFFSMQMADEFGNRITKGGVALAAGTSAAVSLDSRSFAFTDHGNGTYTLACRVTLSGTYSIYIGLGDTLKRLSFSPLQLQVTPGDISAQWSTVLGMASVQSSAGSTDLFTLGLYDENGNAITTPSSSAGVKLTMYMAVSTVIQAIAAGRTPSVQSLNVTYSGGSFTARHQAKTAGHFVLVAEYLGQPLMDSPWVVTVTGGSAEAYTCMAQQTTLTDSRLEAAIAEGVFMSTGAGVTCTRPGEKINLVITCKDVFGNLAGWVPFDAFMLSASASAGSVSVQGLYPQGTSYLFGQVIPTASSPLPITVSMSVSLYGIVIDTGAPLESVIREGSNHPSAMYTYVFGNPIATAGAKRYLMVQAVDEQQVPLGTGGALFNFTVLPANALVNYTDEGTGLYNLTLTATVAGNYSIRMYLQPSNMLISGCPFTVKVMPAPLHGPTSSLVGDGLTIATVASLSSFLIQSRDRYGNSRPYDPELGNPFSTSISGPSPANVTMFDQRNGIFSVSYNITVSGGYKVVVAFSGGAVASGPDELTVKPLTVSQSHSFVYHAAVGVPAVAGRVGRVMIGLRDVFNNTVTLVSAAKKMATVNASIHFNSSRHVNATVNASTIYNGTRDVNTTANSSAANNGTRDANTTVNASTIYNGTQDVNTTANSSAANNDTQDANTTVNASATYNETGDANATVNASTADSTIQVVNASLYINSSLWQNTTLEIGDKIISIAFTFTVAGRYAATVDVHTKYGSFSSQDFVIHVVAGPAVTNASISRMLNHSDFIPVDAKAYLALQAVDAFSNVILRDDVLFSAYVASPTVFAFARVVYQGDGWYLAEFDKLQTGNLTLHVAIVKGISSDIFRNISIRVVEGSMRPLLSLPWSFESFETTVGKASRVLIAGRDVFSKLTVYRDGPVSASIMPPQAQGSVSVQDSGSTIAVQMNATRAGDYAVSVTVAAQALALSPYRFRVSAGPAQPSFTGLSGGGMTVAVAGVPACFSIVVRWCL